MKWTTILLDRLLRPRDGRERERTMMEKHELSAKVQAEVVALLYGPMAHAHIVEPNGGRAHWRSKARESPSAHGPQRLRRDRARARLVAQLIADRTPAA